MKRGDVVWTKAEFMALPVGSELLSIDGDVIRRVDFPEARMVSREQDQAWFPALVRVVGPVEPEWLEAAAQAGRDAVNPKPLRGWLEADAEMREHFRTLALAAVAAADKARGIVNSREEFDALCVERGVKMCDADGTTWTTMGEVAGPNLGPKRWPCLVTQWPGR